MAWSMETNEKSIHNTQLINLILQTSMPIQQKYFGLLSRSKAIHVTILIKGTVLEHPKKTQNQNCIYEPLIDQSIVCFSFTSMLEIIFLKCYKLYAICISKEKLHP